MSSVEPLKARRLYLLLRDRIVTGEDRPQGRLMSEPALATLHGVSRVTVRRALDQLEREGLIERRPGSGTFVTGRSTAMPVVADLSNVLTHLIEMGRRTDVRLLSFNYVAPTPAIAEALHLAPDERVQRSVRVRLIDGQPFSHLTTYVPERIGVSYSETDLASTPLLELLERSGLIAERASQSIGAALLSMTRVVFDPSGNGIEYLQALYRPDRYSFNMDLLRTGTADARRWAPVERARKVDTKAKPDPKARPKRADTQRRTVR